MVPRRELGLQVEPHPERGVTEDVVHDPQLIHDAALLPSEQRVRLVARDRPELHRPVPAQLRAQLGRVLVGVVEGVDVVDAYAEAAVPKVRGGGSRQPPGCRAPAPVRTRAGADVRRQGGR